LRADPKECVVCLLIYFTLTVTLLILPVAALFPAVYDVGIFKPLCAQGPAVALSGK